MLLFIAFAALLIYVLTFTPQIPMADQWETVSLFKNISFNSLWAQHNEHRIIIPKLIYLCLAKISAWDLRYETVFSLLLFTSLIYLIYLTFYRLVKDKIANLLFVFALLVQFSPIHYENLLWGWQLQIMLSVLFVFIAFFNIAFVKDNKIMYFVILFSLVIASFSFISGLLGCIACFFMALRSKSFSNIKIIGYIFFVLLLSLIYFSHFSLIKGSTHIINQLPQIIEYFFIYMGANFIPTHKLGAFLPQILTITGLFGIIITVIGILFVKITWNYGNRDTIIPYSMMLYGILSALATSVGRINYGMSLALLSRYHIFQMFYFLGLMWLLIIYFQKATTLPKYFPAMLYLFITLIILNWISGIAVGIVKMNWLNPITQELRLKAENISGASAKAIYYGPPNKLKEKILILKELKYNVFKN